MPAEFSEHYGCIMIYPHRRDSWQYGAYAARKAFAEVIGIISRSEKVIVCARYEDYDAARFSLPENVRVIEMESDDSWARDVAPTFLTDRNGAIRGVDWGFNAWGGLVDGLYFPWDKDNKMARKLCDALDVDSYDCRDFILEGGSIHSDGEGTILTTEACLLSKGRNPDMTKEEIEEKLRQYLGAERSSGCPAAFIETKPTSILIMSAPLLLREKWCWHGRTIRAIRSMKCVYAQKVRWKMRRMRREEN